MSEVFFRLSPSNCLSVSGCICLMPSSCCAAPPCIVVATIQCAKHFLNHSLPFQVQDNNPAHFKTGQAARFSASAAYLYTSSCPDTRQVCRGDLNSPIKTACCVSAYSLPPPATSGWHRCLTLALGVQPWNYISFSSPRCHLQK